MIEVTVSWPDVLPIPRYDGYSIVPGDPIQRTEMEAGAARQRRRFIDVPSRISLRWKMTNEQYAIFEGWYKWEAREGAAWFNMSLRSGLGFAPHVARFLGQPQAVPTDRGLHWEITTELEIRERPVLTSGATAIVLSESVGGLMSAINGLHDLVHINSPQHLLND
jgi:hypothetical protein